MVPGSQDGVDTDELADVWVVFAGTDVGKAGGWDLPRYVDICDLCGRIQASSRQRR